MNKVTTGEDRFCGPAVLSILTGKSVDVCSQAYRLATNDNPDRPVTSVQIPNLIKAARQLRVEVSPVNSYGFSLYAQLVSLAKKPGVYLVSLPKHVACVEVNSDGKITFNDNHTKTEIDAASSARLHQKVDQIYLVKPLPEPILLSEDIVVERYNSTVMVIKKFKHQNPEDDYSKNMATLNVHSGADLKEVIAQLYNWSLI